MGSDRGWAWCWRRAGAGEKEVRVSKCGGARGAAEGRDFFLGGGFVVGANCGAAIGMGSESGMGMGLVLVLA